MAAARLSRRCGVRPSTRASSVSVWPCQAPLPLTRPALPVASASASSKRVRSTWSGCASRPPRSSSSCRTGSRPSFQRPGSVLSRRTCTTSGLPLSPPFSVAWPARRVDGACGDSAARSNASVCSCRLASTQACSGRRPARRSSVGAASLPCGRPRSVASTSSSAAVPLACTTAAHAGASPSSAGRSVACAVTAYGCALASVAAPLTSTPCACRSKRSTWCDAPGRGSSCSPDTRSPRSSGLPSTTNSSTCRASRSSWSGGFSVAGSTMGPGPGGPVCRLILRADIAVMRSPSQACSCGRHCHCTPSACRSSISSHCVPPAQGRRRLSARQDGPARVPVNPRSSTAGSCRSSQAVPGSVDSSQRMPPAVPRTISSSSATMLSSGTSSDSVVRTGVAGASKGAAATTGALAGEPGVSAMGAQNAMPTLKCSRPLPVSRAQAQSTRSGPTGLRQRTPRP